VYLDQLAQAGVDMEPSERLTEAWQIAKVSEAVKSLVNKECRCIIENVLGGAPDHYGYSLVDPDRYLTKALQAQTVCQVDISFDDAVAGVEKQDGAFAAWLREKAKATNVKIETQQDQTADEEMGKDVVAIGDAAATGAKNLIGALAFMSKHIVAVGVLALAVVVGVVVVTTKASRGD
jgi:hypothetical protein